MGIIPVPGIPVFWAGFFLQEIGGMIYNGIPVYRHGRYTGMDGIPLETLFVNSLFAGWRWRLSELIYH